MCAENTCIAFPYLGLDVLFPPLKPREPVGLDQVPLLVDDDLGCSDFGFGFGLGLGDGLLARHYCLFVALPVPVPADEMLRGADVVLEEVDRGSPGAVAVVKAALVHLEKDLVMSCPPLEFKEQGLTGWSEGDVGDRNSWTLSRPLTGKLSSSAASEWDETRSPRLTWMLLPRTRLKGGMPGISRGKVGSGKKYFVFLFLLFLFSIFTTDAVSGLSLVNGSNLSTADLCLLPLTCSLYL